MLRQTLLVLALALLAGVAGLAAGRWVFSGEQAALDATESSAPVSVELPDISGQLQSLDQFKGRPVVINFWATWCPPCVRELPLLDAWHARRAADGLSVVAIALEPDVGVVADFVKLHQLSLPVWVAEPGGNDLSSRFGNSRGVLPYSVLLDADGNVMQRHAGELSTEMLAAWRDQRQN